MPPWFAAPPKKGEHSPFANDRTLTDADKKDLLAWLAGDLKKGDPADAPLPRKLRERLAHRQAGRGVPDSRSRSRSRPRASMPYQNVSVETDYDEDKWVQALEVQPTAREVVHHVLVSRCPKGAAQRDGEASGFFAAYVPGNNTPDLPRRLREEAAEGLDPASSRSTTRPTARPRPTRRRSGWCSPRSRRGTRSTSPGSRTRRSRFPPGRTTTRSTATHPGPVRRRRSWRCSRTPTCAARRRKYELKTPDGKTATLLDVPHYDFNWQLQYRFAEPVTRAPRAAR